MMPCFKVVSIQRPNLNMNKIPTPLWSTHRRQGNGKLPLKFAIARMSFTRTNIFMLMEGFTGWRRIRTLSLLRWMRSYLESLITVPGPKWLDRYVVRLAYLGDSDGYLHYVYVCMPELRVWMLTDPCKPIWVLKHHINIDQFGEESRDQYIYRVLNSPEMIGNYFVADAQTFHDEVAYMTIRGSLCSYDFKTGRLRSFFYGLYLRHQTILPYSPTLATIGISWLKHNSGSASISFASTSFNYQGRPRKKLKEPLKVTTFLNCCSLKWK